MRSNRRESETARVFLATLLLAGTCPTATQAAPSRPDEEAAKPALKSGADSGGVDQAPGRPTEEDRRVTVWWVADKALPPAIRRRALPLTTQALTDTGTWTVLALDQKQKNTLRRIASKCDPMTVSSCVQKAATALSAGHLLLAAASKRKKKATVVLRLFSTDTPTLLAEHSAVVASQDDLRNVIAALLSSPALSPPAEATPLTQVPAGGQAITAETSSADEAAGATLGVPTDTASETPSAAATVGGDALYDDDDASAPDSAETVVAPVAEEQWDDPSPNEETDQRLAEDGTGDGAAVEESEGGDPGTSTAELNESGGEPSVPEFDMSDFNADEFDTEQEPTDLRPTWSGTVQVSYRSTRHSESDLPDDTRLNDTNQFQLEHTHLKISGDLSRTLAYEIMPCVTHMNAFSVISALLEYSLAETVVVTAGRFLINFGQFNIRSLPGMYTTISRPLLYQSHEDDELLYNNLTPLRLFASPRDDVGLQLHGSLWFFDTVQFSYSVSATNGLRAESISSARFWDDDNTGKQGTGRLSLSYNGSFSLGVAGSVLYNKWAVTDDGRALDQVAWALDGVLTVPIGDGRNLAVRGEVVSMTRDAMPTDTIAVGDESTDGFYITADTMLLNGLGLFAQVDRLRSRRPHANYNETFKDVRRRVTRVLGGILLQPEGPLLLRVEFAHWLQPMGLPDANRLSVQAVLTF